MIFFNTKREHLITFLSANNNHLRPIEFLIETLYSIAHHSTVQYSTVQYSTVQYSTVQYSTAHHSAVQHNTMQRSTAYRITVQHSTQHSFDRFKVRVLGSKGEELG